VCDVTEAPGPGWYADPDNEGEFRWWDGSRWTDSILDGKCAHPELRADTTALGVRLAVVLALASVVLGWVLPKFSPVHAQEPPPTRIMISLGRALGPWPFAVITIAAAVMLAGTPTRPPPTDHQ
jgi:hypothetical protein